jgi:hypothetical protein
MEAERLRAGKRAEPVPDPCDQPLVVVCRRACEGIDGLGVPNNAADVMECGFREIGIEIAGEDRTVSVPHRLVDVSYP